MELNVLVAPTFKEKKNLVLKKSSENRRFFSLLFSSLRLSFFFNLFCFCFCLTFFSIFFSFSLFLSFFLFEYRTPLSLHTHLLLQGERKGRKGTRKGKTESVVTTVGGFVGQNLSWFCGKDSEYTLVVFDFSSLHKKVGVSFFLSFSRVCA